MKELKYWLNKYSTTIICFLMILLLFKSCKSCSTDKRYEYNIKNKTEHYINIIDSMQVIINEQSLNNSRLKDSIMTLQYENNILMTVIDDVKQDKEYYRKQNRNLVNMAENLSKKDTIK